MRAPLFALSGLLLFAATLLLTGLFAAPAFAAIGATAAAVFLPLWYAISVVNAWIGVTSAGYRVSEEVKAFIPAFGVPAAVATACCWVGPNPFVHIGRMPLVIGAGLLLWTSVLLLVGLLGQDQTSGPNGAAAVFVPLWVLLCVVNAAIGVLTAGYTVLEELPVLALNAGAPVAVALLARYRAQHNRTQPNKG